MPTALMKLIRWLLLAWLAVLAVELGHAAPYYNPGDVDFTVTREDAGSCIFDASWGAFPPIRGPYVALEFSLWEQGLYGGYHIFTRTSAPPFNGASIRPNMCVPVKAWRFYKIMVKATTPILPISEEAMVSYEESTHYPGNFCM